MIQVQGKGKEVWRRSEKGTFYPAGGWIWNTLPEWVVEVGTPTTFKRYVIKKEFDVEWYWHNILILKWISVLSRPLNLIEVKKPMCKQTAYLFSAPLCNVKHTCLFTFPCPDEEALPWKVDSASRFTQPEKFSIFSLCYFSFRFPVFAVSVSHSKHFWWEGLHVGRSGD